LIHTDGRRFDVAVEAQRRSLFVLQPWETDLLRQIKRRSPHVPVLAYKDLSSTRDSTCHEGRDDARLPTGLGFCATSRSHPDWFLRDAAGRRLRYDGYPDHWQMDVGSAPYRRAWAQAVAGDLHDDGFDGAFVDNVLTQPDEYHLGVTPQLYPTSSSFQSAYDGALQVVAEAFHVRGLVAVGNISGARSTAGVWRRYLLHLDGALDEHWVVYSWGSVAWDSGPGGWRTQVDNIAEGAAAGRLVAAFAQAPEHGERAYDYALASYLLASGATTLFGTGDSSWSPAYQAQLGRPLAPYRPVAGSPHVYQRDFAGGQVVVNAGRTTSARVAVVGRHVTLQGTPVQGQVEIPPRGGVILLSHYGCRCRARARAKPAPTLEMSRDVAFVRFENDRSTAIWCCDLQHWASAAHQERFPLRTQGKTRVKYG